MGWYIMFSNQPLPASGRYLLRLLELRYPCSGSAITDEETLGIYRELHPDVMIGVSPRYEADRAPDTLGPNRHAKVGGSVTHFDRYFYHLGLLSFL